MKWDPYTLVVVLDQHGAAEGTLYVDDGESYDFEKGGFIHRRFQFTDSVLSSENIGASGPKTNEYLKAMTNVRVERIVVVGAPAEWQQKSSVTVIEDGVKEASTAPLQFTSGQAGKAAYAVVKNPNVGIGRSWKIEF
jgi:alpha 1,3-glucosidase